MKLKRFTEEGARKFVSFLSETKSVAAPLVPEELLADPIYAEIVKDIETPAPGFVTKFEFADAAHAAFGKLGIDEVLRTDKLMWMWLTARYFEDLCKDANGQPRKRLEITRYVTNGHGTQYRLDKNLLYFPWKMLLLHGHSARWMLEAPLGSDSKVAREIANQYRRNVHTQFIELARRLYFDETRRVVRKGATNSSAAGNLRDLERTMTRLDLTYDIYIASADQLMAMLPEDRFGRWIKHA